MPPRSEAPSKKPTGGRPTPKRLWSLDHLRRDRSSSGTDEGEGPADENPFRARQTEKTILEQPDDPFTDQAQYTDGELVASPELQDGREPRFRLSASKIAPPALDLSRPGATAPEALPPPSPSRRRWDTIRHHVMPPVSSPPPDSSSAPERPSTPKLPRFTNKKAFQKVVETAQTQSHFEGKRFSDALWRACWAAHVPEVSHRSRPEREGTLGALGSLGNVNLGSMGSSLHLPFMASTTSLPTPTTAASSLVNFPNSFKSSAMRRPQSTMSLATLGGTGTTVSRIIQVLQFQSSANRPWQLPYEPFVLSALLTPFYPKAAHPNLDDEQGIAAETFDFIHRSWPAPTVQAELERCIWCCKAASAPSASRMRILGTLSAILFSRGRSFVADSPVILQTLLQVLFSLQYNLTASGSAVADVQSIVGYISAVLAGSCGQLTPASVEKEFGVRFSDDDNEAAVREAVIAESAVSCIETGPLAGRRWAMLAVINYWPVPEPNATFTLLLACIHWRKLKRFLAASLFLFSESFPDTNKYAEMVITLLRTRILPEIDGLRQEDAFEIRNKTIQLTLEVLCLADDEGQEYLLMRLCDWYQKDQTWKENIEAALGEILAQSEWQAILRVVPTFVSLLPKELQTPVLTFVLPTMHKRLVSDPPEVSNAALSQFLDSVSRLHPKVFYKPLFACAAASKDATVVNQLCILNALSKFVPDILTRDPEMMSVALVSDTVTMSQSTSTDGGRPWGTPRIGQVALLVELIERLREVPGMKDMGFTAAHVKFALGLEVRLGIAIEAKEKNVNMPLSHRLLLCVLFREIRLLTRTLKSATWLSSVIAWTLYLEELAKQDGAYREVSDTMRRIELVYSQAEDSSKRDHKRKPTAFSPLSPEVKTTDSQNSQTSQSASQDHFKSKMKLVSAISTSAKQTALDLLVTVSGMLEADHYLRLGPILWHECLLDPSDITPAAGCFLFMQYSEKRPDDCVELMEDDMTSPEAAKRRSALERFAVLSTWRYQILSQEVILDRNHRRPFKLQRPPVLFVATDIGSSLFIYEDDTEEYKDVHGHVIPLELRRRLSEIGWAQEDRLVDPRVQRIKTPMTLLPSQHLERLDPTSQEGISASESQPHNASPDPSPKSSPASSPVGRRDSNASTKQSMKRRPIFVPTLVALFPQISLMVADEDFMVANLARDILMDFMRDDPTLVARQVFQIISGDDQEVSTAISTLRAFLHVRNVLPPAMAHHILNHLAGFLKTSVKQIGPADPLRAFAYVMPIVAKLVTQVSKLSIREIRRAKIDPFMIPSGSLWFPPNAPTGYLFPRYLEAIEMHPFSEIPPNLVWITMVRTSQNMLFLSMLQRNPQDIKIIRKNMSHFELPALEPGGVAPTLTLEDMYPYRHRPQRGPRSRAQVTLKTLSLTLSRSYLLLVQQIFQCMSRHLSDREELGLLIDGLNRILLAHGDDIGIVAHVMLALMTAATRFKRLFISGGGYALFMPAVVKTFAETEHHPNIKRAILYAANRFYALHQESFVFQSFDTLGPILAAPEVDGEWVAPSIYALFSSLRNGVAPGTPDAAGIHDMNRTQEREALIMAMAEDVPQTFIASLKRSTAKDEKELGMTIPEEYEGRRLKLDDLVKLFLTVIAHNPASPRAEHFLRFLRLLTPHMHDVSRSVQTVLRGGILALGSILSNKVLTKQPKEALKEKSVDEAKYEALADATPSKTGDGQASTQSDFLTMRLEYLSLVTAFTKVGGHIGNPASLTPRVMEIIKIVLRDSKTSGEKVSVFLAEFVRTALMRKNAPSLKEATAIMEAFVPLASSYMAASVDFSRLYNILAELMENPVLGCDPGFSKLIVSQYCRLGLDACEAAATEDFLFTFPLREAVVKLLVSSIANCGAEVMSELEKQPLSHNFLAGIVLPIVMMLRTSADIIEQGQWKDSWQRDGYSKIWLRLLALILSVLKGEQIVVDPALAAADRRKSSADQSSKTQSFASVKAFSIALQILKVIVVRAQDDISEVFPGIWMHVAGVLKSVLEDGDATFAFSLRDISEPPSPAFSPQRSNSFEQQQMFPAFASSASLHSRRRLSPPRMIDYLTWSFIQWLWLRRSPLMLQMRIFIQERVANLANELRQQGSSSVSAITGSSRRSQRYSTVFSKPRKSMLGSYSPTNSATSTPRTSAILQGSVSLPVFSDFSSPKLTASQSLGPPRQAGYALMPSPISPSGRTSQDSIGPKIVHLGPVNPYSSPGAPRASLDMRPDMRDSSLRSLSKEMTVRSPGLVMMTYRRIRLVQKLMGYSELLPMSGSQFYASDEEAEGDLDADIRVWSQRDAIEAVVEEARELLDEFRESSGFGDVGDESMVMVDSQLTLIQDQM